MKDIREYKIVRYLAYFNIAMAFMFILWCITVISIAIYCDLKGMPFKLIP